MLENSRVVGLEVNTERTKYLVISRHQTVGQNHNLLISNKGKVVPVLPLIEHHTMKAYWGSGGTAPPIL
jgi:hypothetical protein